MSIILLTQKIVGLLCLYIYNVSTGCNGRTQIHNDDNIIYHNAHMQYNIIFYTHNLLNYL